MWCLCSNHFSFVCYEVGLGFCPERVFGGAGEGPHVQTNAMLAPSSRRDFPVGNCGAVNPAKKSRRGFFYRSGHTNPERGILPAQGQHRPHGGVSLRPGDPSRQVYFQLQSRIIQAPQRILRFASSTAEEAKQILQEEEKETGKK